MFALLDRPGEETRIIGGAVRDALLKRSVTPTDVDFATTIRPRQVMELAAEAGVRAVPTGIEYGTVTLAVDGTAFEVTTLREDIETDGRYAVVRFGRDWAADARRRDFTMNSLSADADGRVCDPVGGYGDLISGRVTFIGDPDARIAEDRLRVLRLFRFQAAYGRVALSARDYGAAVRARRKIRLLSAERIGGEMRRLLLAGGVVDAVAAMQDGGILAEVTGGVGTIGALRRFIALEPAGTAAFAPRLAALAVRSREDIARLTERLRLAKAQSGRMAAALAVARDAPPADARHAMRLLYRHDTEAYRDGVMLALAWRGRDPTADESRLISLSEQHPRPIFPVSGSDVVALGVTPGPAVGDLLAALEAWWIERDFVPDRADLRARLRKMLDRR